MMDGEYGAGIGGCELKDTIRAVPRITEVVPESADKTPRRNAVLIPTEEELRNNPQLLKENNIHLDYKRNENYQEMPTVIEVLKERGSRYGSFVGHAEITQKIKNIIFEELQKRNKKLRHTQQEALDMIAHKIGRIINGDADYTDSWIDIAGYAQLEVDRINGKLT